jgi:uncharacterized protein (TIGR03437 family)
MGMCKARNVIVVFALTCSFNICEAQLQPLSYRPVTSRYSTPLDRLVMISSAPDVLHIYDASTTNDTTVSLPKTPLGLAVSPDGLHAAVTHDGLISWIDLSAASLIKTIPITGQPTTVFMSNTYAMYYVPGNGYTGGINGVNLLTGAAVTGPGLSYYYATNGVFDASQQYMYLSQDGSSPDDMEKATIANGQLTSANNSGGAGQWPYHGLADCAPYYLSVDGTRVYTSCGTVVHATSDKTTDMYYLQNLPVNISSGGSLAESASLGMLAAIQGVPSYQIPTSPSPDIQVQLLRSDYLTPAGTLALLHFTTPSGSYPAHGKAVFFSKDSSRLYVVAQADSTSNLTNGFGVEVFNIGSPAACSVTLASSSLSIASSGGYASVAVTATPDCIYAATTNQPWISFGSGAFGSGNGTLQWIVRPNTQGQSRSATITMNGQTLTIQQSAAPATLPNPAPLSFNVVDSDYSTALDRIVAAAASPNELHIYDPAGQTDTVVSLSLTPTCVSVAPDGLHAAVGHDGYVSYIDLHAGSVLHMFPVPTPVGHVLLAGNGYIYVLAGGIFSFQIATGTVTSNGGFLGGVGSGEPARLEPNGKYFYTFSQGFSKWDITNGPAVYYSDSSFNTNLGSGGWLFQDGTAIIGQNGQVSTSSDVAAQDGQYIGTFPGVTGVQWAANSSALLSTALIPASYSYPTPTLDNQVAFFGDAYLGAAGSILLPQFSAGGISYPAHGHFAFWNSSATALYAIERADSSANLLSTDAVFTISPGSPPAGCAATPLGSLATLPARGGFGSAPVSAGAGCPWSASSDSSWLTITAGQIGAGPASISWSAAANTAATSRAANITIGGQSYPVTELGTSITPLALTPSSLSFSATWGTPTAIPVQSFSVTGGTGPFTVAASPSWVIVSAGVSNTYVVSVSPASLPAGTNTGVVTVNSADGQVQLVTVTLNVTANFTVSPTSITFQYGQTDPLPTASFTLADGTTGTTSFSVYPNQYLTVKASSSTLPATVQLSPLSTLAPGTYLTSVSVYAANRSVNIPVKITYAGAQVSVAAITDAANFVPGVAVSPGEIVTIWGSNLGPAALTSFTLLQNRLPFSLAGTSVRFNQYAAPIIYTSTGSVCVIVPYEVAGLQTVNVSVSFNGSVSAQFTQPVAPTAPHFFTKTYQAAGQIAALNSDASLNSSSNPASPDSVVVLYATGEGVTSPPGIDGSLVNSITQPLANVTVTIGGQPAIVAYAGGSPTSIEGLLQVNVRVPAGTPAGNAPVTLVIGSGAAPLGGTIAVGP